LLTFRSVFIRALSRNTDVADALSKVEKAVDRYIKSICSLSATIGVEILENQEQQLQLQRKQLALQEELNEGFGSEQVRRKKAEVLKWLYDGDPWDRYSELTRQRARFPESGTWFLQSPEFTKWFTGGTQSLICWGARILPCPFSTDIWVAGAGKSFITFALLLEVLIVKYSSSG
jgi:hypothetical protein